MAVVLGRAGGASADAGEAVRVPARAAVYDERFSALRAALPARAVVGYVTDRQAGERLTAPEALQEFFLTQFSLAPAIVVRGAIPSLSVGNFPDRDRRAMVQRLAELADSIYVIHDFGEGVLLLGKIER